MAAGVLVLGLAAVGLFLGTRLSRTQSERNKLATETESRMIGQELAPLPEESRNFIFRLLLTDDPANDAGVYAGAIAQLSQFAARQPEGGGPEIGFPFTIAKLTEIAKERFG